MTTAHIRYIDCLPSKITITFAAKQQPTMEVEFTFLSLGPTSGSGGAPADYAYTVPADPGVHRRERCAGALRWRRSMTSARRRWWSRSRRRSSRSSAARRPQGVDSLAWTDRMVRVSVTHDAERASPRHALDGLRLAMPPAALQIDGCTQPGRGVSVLVAAPQVAEQPTPVGNGNLLGVTTIYECTGVGWRHGHDRARGHAGPHRVLLRGLG
jgi:hypothetical protein